MGPGLMEVFDGAEFLVGYWVVLCLPVDDGGLVRLVRVRILFKRQRTKHSVLVLTLDNGILAEIRQARELPKRQICCLGLDSFKNLAILLVLGNLQVRDI